MQNIRKGTPGQVFFDVRKGLVGFCLLLISIPGLLAAESSSRTPLEAFAALPTYADISLSPDGSQAVALRAIHGTYHVVLLDFASGQTKLLMASDPDNFLFNWCQFANPSRVVCSIRSYIVMKAGSIGAGTRWYRDGRTVATRLLAINTDGSEQIQLIPEPRSRTGGELEWNSPNQDDVISWLPEDSKHILVQLARDDRLAPSVYKLNIYNNRMRRQQRFLSSISRWYADDEGRIRFAVGRRADATPVTYTFESGTRQTLDVSHFDGLEPPTILSLAPDGKSSFMIANHKGSNTRGLHRVELATGRVLETLLSDPDYDLTRYWNHQPSRQMLYAGYEEDGEHLTWFNSDIAEELNAVRTTLSHPRFMNIWSATPDLAHLILYVEGNGVAPSYYRFSRADQSLLKLGDVQQGPIVDFEHIIFAARDGQAINAYVALPGPADAGPYPTIVDPHGGPWARDSGRYFFWNQYFLDRGYAVLKPNFRGSTGYGDAFTRAGFEAWGEAMQDDVIDGLERMIELGYTDPDRTCIHGGSYGGYVALVAAYKTPEKFNCAISFAGVTDLADLKDRWWLFRFGQLSTARLPRGDALTANSPIEHVERMKLPLLIVHGDVDRSVMIEQSRNLVAQLEAAGVEHTYIEQTNGDHFFSLEKHRLEYLEALEQFLDTHLGGSTKDADR